MGNQNKGMLVILQEFGEPFDVLHVQIVGGLVEQQNLGVLQEQLRQQHLAALTATKLAHVLIEADTAQAEAVSKFFNLAVQGIKAGMLQLRLDFAHSVHHFIHFLRSSITHFFVIIQHLLLLFIKSIKGGVQHLANGHPLLQGALLIQIAHSGLARPLHLAIIGQHVARNDIQKGGFTFAVSTDQAYMLAPLQLEGNIF